MNSHFRITVTSFIAGFYAVLCFHQLAVLVLYLIGLIPFKPFNMAPTHPFDIPSVISASMWGGFWGILFAFTFFKRYRGLAYWIMSFLLGGILLSLVAALIVAPLKGYGLMWGLNPSKFLVMFIVNGFWGLGTAIIYRLLNR